MFLKYLCEFLGTMMLILLGDGVVANVTPCSTVSRSPTSSSRGALPGRAVSLRFTLWSLTTSVVTPGVSGRRTVGILYRISHPGRCGAR